MNPFDDIIKLNNRFEDIKKALNLFYREVDKVEMMKKSIFLFAEKRNIGNTLELDALVSKLIQKVEVRKNLVEEWKLTVSKIKELDRIGASFESKLLQKGLSLSDKNAIEHHIKESIEIAKRQEEIIAIRFKIIDEEKYICDQIKELLGMNSPN